MARVVSERAENIVEKGEIADYQHFLLFLLMFSIELFYLLVGQIFCLVYQNN